MNRDFIVHTVAEEDVTVQVTGPKGQALLAKVPGLTVELIDMENGKAHTHTLFDDLNEARQVCVPGQELTLTIARKSGSPTVTTPDPTKADKYRNEALRHEDKTEEQLKNEAAADADRKAGKIDPEVKAGMEAAAKAAAKVAGKDSK
jgi:stringent starvation protein B